MGYTIERTNVLDFSVGAQGSVECSTSDSLEDVLAKLDSIEAGFPSSAAQRAALPEALQSLVGYEKA